MRSDSFLSLTLFLGNTFLTTIMRQGHDKFSLHNNPVKQVFTRISITDTETEAQKRAVASAGTAS